MRLHDFIRQNMEEILVQWEIFASTLLPAATSMTGLLLRDHAHEILEAVMNDIAVPQTAQTQDDKSKGLIEKLPGAPQTAAETHGLLRATSGFEIKQMASEYRALRASVLKLWLTACDNTPSHMDDIIRFNEAIDQALAESIDFFTEKIEERRNLFLGMLGHDMRTPLQSIQMTAMVLKGISSDEKVAKAATRLIDSGARMAGLLDELVEFNKIKLGLGFRITTAPQDMAVLINDELNELRAAYPDKQLDLSVSGPTKGEWDGGSLKRVVGNLVVNAIKYGHDTAPIKVVIAGVADNICLEVRDKGAPMDETTIKELFEPLKRGLATENSTKDSLGLGLFISKQIVSAHGGQIDAHCDEGETVFVVKLPRVSSQLTKADLLEFAHMS